MVKRTAHALRSVDVRRSVGREEVGSPGVYSLSRRKRYPLRSTCRRDQAPGERVRRDRPRHGSPTRGGRRGLPPRLPRRVLVLPLRHPNSTPPVVPFRSTAQAGRSGHTPARPGADAFPHGQDMKLSATSAGDLRIRKRWRRVQLDQHELLRTAPRCCDDRHPTPSRDEWDTERKDIRELLRPTG
jgi:hypothetical protein